MPDDDLEEHERLPVDVLTRLMADWETGGLAPLEDYLARFPGMEAAVEREYERLILEPPAASADAGPRRIGPYELVRELGRGGQGTVWLARDPRLDREVALKVVPRSPLSGRVSQRFAREARAASQLDHPGLCPVFDVGEDESIAWLAMRYVPGPTLAQVVAERESAPGDPAADALLVERMARALHVAHEAGIVHRDVKPANVIVTEAGEPVLFDFGIARDDDDAAKLTLTGDALGTPIYMSPEQLAGEPVDRRTDVWALGVVAYELLTGTRPFEAPTRGGVIQAVTEREPERPSRVNGAIPRDFEVVVTTALQKDADRRYHSALDLAEDLARAREGRPILARPVGPHARLLRWARRNPLIAASLTAVFLVLSVALAVTNRLLADTREARDANATLLSEVAQLADAKVAADLLEEEPELWPAVPARAAEIDDWLERARALQARVDEHRRALETIDERLTSAAAGQFAIGAGTETRDWMEEQLTEIIASVEALLEKVPAMEARFELANTLRETTVEALRDEWRAAAERVRADPRFDGLQLEPQLGLVPLGPDPDSQLEEFGHVLSGAPPERDPATGRLVLTEDSSVVLVLLPGGDSSVGCDPPSPERPVGDPFVDPDALENDGPVHFLRLDPFFISKFELTCGQWQRQSGRKNAVFNKEPVLPLLEPVESVSADDASIVLAQMQLVLPTEAQWEYAARAGTTTIWYTGDDPQSLDGHVNFSDEGNRAGAPPAWEIVPWLDDGFLNTGRVGSFAPNPFGLHDVCGNVFEWTRSPSSSLEEYPLPDGDGNRDDLAYPLKVVRGGSFAKPESFARSGHRAHIHQAHSWPDLGVRPARALDLAP